MTKNIWDEEVKRHLDKIKAKKWQNPEGFLKIMDLAKEIENEQCEATKDSLWDQLFKLREKHFVGKGDSDRITTYTLAVEREMFRIGFSEQAEKIRNRYAAR